MSDSLHKKTVNGLAWSTIENFAGLGIHFIFGIILARLLSPSEYGILGMIAVFMAVSHTFIKSGFGYALIRKKNRTEDDCATVFYFNIAMAFIIYWFLFICAPFIARFFHTPLLKDITRVLSLDLIIGSFSIVHTTLLTARLDFKTSAKVTLVANLIAGFIAIYFAYTGYGVWSLVIQTLTATTIRTIMLWLLAKWRPIAKFSKKSFHEMFSFGSKLLASRLIDTLYANIYPILIGRMFSAETLGLYTRANGYAALPSSNLSAIIHRVTFPVLAQLQDDNERLANSYRKILKMAAFIIFPCMMFLYGIADPLVRFLITDKWEGCIYLLQIICFSMMWYPIHAINLNLLQVKGRSDLFLKLEVIKKIISLAILLVSYRWGVVGMCYGGIVSSFFCLFVNTYYTGKLIDVGYLRQMHDVFPIFCVSALVGTIVLFVSTLNIEYNLVKIVIGGVLYALIYLACSFLFFKEELHETVRIIKRK